MKRITFSSLAGFALLTVLVSAGFAPRAIAATPNPNGAFVNLRVFNDCPLSTVTVVNTYPSLLSIEDAVLACSGFANLHTWAFSVNGGASAALFDNNAAFNFSADMMLTGTGKGEFGLRISPWFSPDVDGRFNVRVIDSPEIACFGGRLPFFSFTGAFGVTYTKGNPIHMEMIYRPHGLSALSPATIEYKLTYLSNSYTSGPLAFDQANPTEDPPHGLWGMLNEARVGGYIQARLDPGNFNNNLKATYANIVFNRAPHCEDAVASEAVLWPPNHKYHGISVLGVTDADGDPVTIAVTGVTQDEPTNGRGDGNTCPDGQISGSQASVRAERTGTPGVPGNGRVYAINFTADDGRGGQCDGTVNVCVPHDQGAHSTCTDDGQRYNSLGPCNNGNTLAGEGSVNLEVSKVTQSQAEVSFSVPTDLRVDVSVFDVTGRRLATIESSELSPGSYQRVWNMEGHSKGLYFVRMHAGEVTMTKTIVKVQ